MSTYAFDQSWELEQERLRLLELWLDPGSVRALETVGVGAGWRCLEVGGGRGSMARWMSERAGVSGRVLVTDLDTTLLEQIEASNVETRRHDITTGPPEPEAFDVAHTRLVLGWIAERERAMRNIIDALAPGGWLVCEEMEFTTHMAVTPSKTYDRINEATLRVFGVVGFDCFLGRRLPALMRAMGLQEVEAEGRIAFGSREENPGIGQFKLSLERLRDGLVAAGPASNDDIDDVLRLLDDPSFEAMPPAVVSCWGRKPKA